MIIIMQMSGTPEYSSGEVPRSGSVQTGGRGSKRIFCTDCGKQMKEKHKFCPECGSKKGDSAIRKDSCRCGTLFKKGQRYCKNCGEPVSSKKK